MVTGGGSQRRLSWAWPDDREDCREILRGTAWWRRPRLWALRLFWKGVHAFVWRVTFSAIRAEAERIGAAPMAETAEPVMVERPARGTRPKRKKNKHRRRR